MLNFLAQAAPALIQGGFSLFGAGKADKQAKKSAQAAREAAAAQEAQYQKGIGSINEGYDSALGYLAPFAQAGQKGIDYLMDIIGGNGAGGQSEALDRYNSNPSSAILDDVLSEVTRRTGSEYAGAGAYRSGGRTEDLSRRLSDVRLKDFYNYEGMIQDTARSGQNAASNSATLSGNRGSALANLYKGIGDVKASGIVGSSNAQTGGSQAGLNYLAPAAGKLSEFDYSSFLSPNNSNIQWDTWAS